MSKLESEMFELINTSKARSTRSEVFCKKGVLKNFAEFLCQSFFFNKVAGLKPAMDTTANIFSVDIAF